MRQIPSTAILPCTAGRGQGIYTGSGLTGPRRSRLGELLLQDLPGAVARQGVEELDFARDLVVGEVLLDVRADLVGGELLAVGGDDEGLQPLPELLVVDPDHRRLLD